MDAILKEKFLKLWNKFYGDAALPIIFYYADTMPEIEKVKSPKEHRCVIADIARVRSGRSLAFDRDSLGCFGGRRYFGFSEETMPNFEYFLSYGIPGQLEGERYKKTPELVKESMKWLPHFEAPARFIIFKRWDNIESDDKPAVVIFFAPPDVLSGIFTLINYDESEQNGVYAPFGAGCATIVRYPYLENGVDCPRAVLGMFDVSARPCVPSDTLSLAVPMKKFVTMIENMEESFLITESWTKVRKRIIAGKKRKK